MNTGKNIKIKYSVSDATLLSFEALCQQGTTLMMIIKCFTDPYTFNTLRVYTK